MLVVREQLYDEFVGAVDIRRFTRQRNPSERTPSLAKQRSHVLRHEPRNVECVANTLVVGFGPNVVTVVERHCPSASEFEHRANVIRDGTPRAANVFVRIRIP